MSSILGAALALTLGTAPLSQLLEHPVAGYRLILAVGGLILLAVTLLLLLLVLRPSAVSFADVQRSGPGRMSWFRSLHHWKDVVEAEPDSGAEVRSRRDRDDR
jgi:hypothetical protein